MRLIDLRSDTVTRPSAAMRDAMARAEVGDDVYGEDPTVRALEDEVSGLLGKEAALFVPSGSMSNQIALLVHTRPGDEVIVGVGAHIAWYESGAGAAIAGVQFLNVGEGGLFTAEDVARAVKPERDYHPRTRLVALENTHNRGGGRVFPQREVQAVAELATARGLSLHLDGARIWNASVASGLPLSELAAAFDTVSVCFSKGLGAPVGSALVADRERVRMARRFRKMLGGGMRQAGVIAAGALYALRNHLNRLEADHRHARLFVQSIAGLPGISLAAEVETNIVVLHTEQLAEDLARKLAADGVLASVMDQHSLRFVTHLDVNRDDVLQAARALSRQLLGSTAAV